MPGRREWKPAQQSSLSPPAHTLGCPRPQHILALGTAPGAAILGELVVRDEYWSLGVPMPVTTRVPGLEGAGKARAVPRVMWGMQATLSL